MANHRIIGSRPIARDNDISELNIGYFLEDVGQESFVKALVTCVASDIGFDSEGLNHDVRNATGGKRLAMTELKRFLRDVKKRHAFPFDVLVVAIDGNCQRYREKRDEIAKIVQQTNYPRHSGLCSTRPAYRTLVLNRPKRIL